LDQIHPMSAVLFEEHFTQPALDSRLHWFHPPPSWRVDAERRLLSVEPAAGTDFWQRTHYGFQADNGHFLGLEMTGSFVLSTRIVSHPIHQYDQAGLMFWVGADCWIKTSVEHELEGAPQLGVVVTSQGYSDWSMQDSPSGPSEIRLRLWRRGDDVTAEFGRADDVQWKPMRVTHWPIPEDRPLWCGLYACSPKGAGFRAEFKGLVVESV
jgi:uncharacterized protein